MKKLLSLAIAFAVTLPLSACAARNNGINNRNGVTDNTRIGTRRLSNITENNMAGSYRDGVYTGYGNAHRNGNERAIVQIRNGRIVDIDLASVNQQGTINNVTGNRVNTGNGTITGNRMNTGNGATTNNRMNIGNGTTTDGRIGNQSGTGVGLRNNTVPGNQFAGGNTQRIPGMFQEGNVPRNTTGLPGGNTIGNATDLTPGNIPSNIPNNATGLGRTNTNGFGGGAMGTPMGTTLDGARANLENAMIQRQTYDVNIANNDTAMTSTINNWKLAVQRALSQAR